MMGLAETDDRHAISMAPDMIRLLNRLVWEHHLTSDI